MSEISLHVGFPATGYLGPSGAAGPAVAGAATSADADEDGVPFVAARILVVDDEDVVRMLVVDLLRERGHFVQEAEDGHAAMSKLRSGDNFDLMITDIALPGGLDGSTLAREARRLRPVLPILFITGYAFIGGSVTLEPGIPVLTKPFTFDALFARISLLLAA